MTPQQTAMSYDKLAFHWNSDEFNRSNGIAQHHRAFRFASTKGTAIDIGCGSSGRMIDLMISEGFDVEGLDISPEMVRLARLRHPQVLFHLADICDWEFPRKFDLISAWDSIWHAPLAAHEAILRKLCGGLNHGGILIFTSGGVDRAGEVTHPFLGQPLYHAALGIPRLLEIVSREGCICRHLEYDQYPEPHLYLIIQRAEISTESSRQA
ncbi:MAG: class I SAM-dependent methyltransferase [Armatimonadetes bacterium]|nr:class I SAM-dependent methyltransferase [Akkermansiaceae bacterium]